MSRKAEYIDALEAAILIKHRCKPMHRETVFVREETEEKETVWEGYVDAFDLTGHKEAKTCYAWQHSDGKGGIKIFAVLENQVIDSARRAVQAAIFMDAQPLHRLPPKDRERFNQQLGECEIENSDDLVHAQRGVSENAQHGQNPED